MVSASGRKILIVEDNRIVAMEISRRLQNLGYTIAGTAASGREAVDLAIRTMPNLILMDINLQGDMNGIEAAEEIRARMDVPLIYLTAYSDEATLEQAKRTEPDSYLIKPFEERELYSNIEMALYKHKVRHSGAVDHTSWVREFLREIPDPVVATDPRGRILFLNPAAEQMTGYSSADGRGKSVADLLKLSNIERGTPLEMSFPEAGEKTGIVGIPMEITLESRTGEVIPAECSMALIREEAGENGGFLLIFRDLRPRHAHDRTLREQAAFFRTILDQLDVAIGCVGTNLRLIYTNPAFIEMTADWTTAPELTKEPLSVIFPLVQSFSVNALQAVLRSGKSEVMEEEVRGGSFSRRIRVQRIPIRGQTGVAGVMLVIREA